MNMNNVHVIQPTAVYDLVTGRAALGLAKGCLPREIRLGRLRASKRAGKIFILGEFLLEWLQDAEITRYRRPLQEQNGAKKQSTASSEVTQGCTITRS